MTIIRTNRFKKDFARLPDHIKSQAVKQFQLFFENPEHPSLNIKKMKGVSNIWEGRISKGYRITFNWDGKTIIMRRIGTHDVLNNP